MQQRDIAGRGGPADQRRKRPGRAADHDILRRAALEPDGVDQHVEQDRHQQDAGGDIVDRQPHQNDRQRRDADADMMRRLAIHASGGQRAALRPLHLGVEVGLIPLVERARCARAQRNAQDRGEADHRMDRNGRREHAAQAGEYDEAHHARLGQRKEIAPVGGDGQGVVGDGHLRAAIGAVGARGKGQGNTGSSLRRRPTIPAGVRMSHARPRRARRRMNA